MPSSTTHPRRRPAKASDANMTPSLIDSFQSMSLRKGETFHPNGNTVSNAFWDPLEASTSPQMAARSATCPKSLEDLLLGAGERRTADLLARVDKAVETNSRLALSAVLTEPDTLPAFADHDITLDNEPVRKTRTQSHGSDSGIGSSIASDDAVPAKTMTAPPTAADNSLSGISAVTERRGLSKYACEQIHKHIVHPMLREEALKDFHPLVKSVPSRIGKKDIKTLRDLEKTLIFLAPDYSRTPTKYLRFCERTIRVLHTTVTTLHESDQRAPEDRPYTQGYFFDLVEQIRRYAAIMAATRERLEKGEKADKLDYSPDESISLIGGMSHNGKPAELVRHKDGKVISLATGEVLSSEDVASASMKRSMDIVDVDEDEVLRSMARRKKNAKPEIHECSLCDKEFKRPCDLTKHLKTHERPWKCPDSKCKYHEHGWPTEKERDRHVNDKHSNAPPLYHCMFPPCPYTSKRESNCKQHMEKAHGWDYVRSKNNGKGRASITHLPKGSIPPSPSASGSSAFTPLTPVAPSPHSSWASGSVSGSSSRHDSMPPPMAGPSGYASPDFVDHFNFDFNNMSSGWPMTPALSADRRSSCDASSSSNSGFQLDGSAFDEGVTPEDLTNYAFNFNDYNFGPQQVTPDSSAACASSTDGFPHLSPGAQLDQTFTDAMTIDGGNYAGDFTLFGNNQQASGGGEMFPSLASWGNFGGQYDASHAPLQTGNSTLEDLFPELRGH